MNIGQICSRPALSVDTGVPLSEVATMMKSHHIGAVVVTKSPMEQPVAVGIITDRDIVHAQLERAADLSRLSVVDAMTRDPLILNEQTSVEDAIGSLRARGVRRAPVVTINGMLIGLISTDDLLAQVAKEIADLAQTVSQQPGAERG
jgi:CBS domain-containing protein